MKAESQVWRKSYCCRICRISLERETLKGDARWGRLFSFPQLKHKRGQHIKVTDLQCSLGSVGELHDFRTMKLRYQILLTPPGIGRAWTQLSTRFAACGDRGTLKFVLIRGADTLIFSRHLNPSAAELWPVIIKRAARSHSSVPNIRLTLHCLLFRAD